MKRVSDQAGKNNNGTDDLLPSIAPLHLKALQLRMKLPRLAIKLVVLGADLTLELLILGALLALKITQSVDEFVDIFALEGTVAVSFDIMLVADLSNELFAFYQTTVVYLRNSVQFLCEPSLCDKWLPWPPQPTLRVH